MQNDMKEDSSVGTVADTVPAEANPLAQRVEKPTQPEVE